MNLWLHLVVCFCSIHILQKPDLFLRDNVKHALWITTSMMRSYSWTLRLKPLEDEIVSRNNKNPFWYIRKRIYFSDVQLFTELYSLCHFLNQYPTAWKILPFQIDPNVPWVFLLFSSHWICTWFVQGRISFWIQPLSSKHLKKTLLDW